MIMYLTKSDEKRDNRDMKQTNNEKHKKKKKKENLNIETLWRSTINTRKQETLFQLSKTLSTHLFIY